MSFDVFLTAFRAGEEVPVDMDALEAALARVGVDGERTIVQTVDGGRADLLVDSDGASFLIERLTPELSRLLFAVATDTRLVTLPADGTPSALVLDPAQRDDLPEELRAAASVVTSPRSMHTLLESSRMRRDEIRAAR
jgi:hypothetical protein